MSNLSEMSKEHERRLQARKSLVDWAMRLNDQAAEWDLESVKHLVVLNAAGVAGSTTLLANGANAAALKRALVIVLALFGAGVILAVLNLTLASRSFDTMAKDIHQRIETELDGDWSVPIDAHVFRPPEKGRKMNQWGVRVAVASAVCAVIATGFLTYTLFN
ncbi:hypothetical protein [Cupriavidus sp. UME77]|uniref:hypothetical protein n=1 Tax=Cupriavidus sp. UME77 TaxID=1862321 RepID=UPI00160172E2|nr:hypothetical protein [Cupriavidus sp. UME77]